MAYLIGICIFILVIGLLYFIIVSSTRYIVLCLLKKYEIPYKSWDQNGTTRTLDKLIKSVNNGEISLEPGENNLVLHINVAVATVRCKHNSRWFVLQEFRQINSHGELRPRAFSGIGGKIRTRNESPRQALQRELAEELGGSKSDFKDPENYTLIEGNDEVLGPQPSDGHPGALDVYHRKHFLCTIDHHLYQHEYHEKRDDGKIVYFRWVEIKKSEL